MHRRPLGNGRRLALIGAIVLVVGCLLPWYTVGGNGGLPELAMRAFDGTGIALFLAALATLALIALPYAAGDRPLGVDRGLSFARSWRWWRWPRDPVPVLQRRARRAGRASPGQGVRLLGVAARGDHPRPRGVRHLAGGAAPLTAAVRDVRTRVGRATDVSRDRGPPDPRTTLAPARAPVDHVARSLGPPGRPPARRAPPPARSRPPATRHPHPEPRS